MKDSEEPFPGLGLRLNKRGENPLKGRMLAFILCLDLVVVNCINCFGSPVVIDCDLEYEL